MLIIDNELHREELVACHWSRSFLSHAPTCPSPSCVAPTWTSTIWTQAGRGERPKHDVIVIDALYRILPEGISENDNADSQRHNRLDGLARKNSASIIVIHHASKGNQSEKSVTDVGAGAGAIARATDTHMVIRPHAEEGYHVFEAVTRSGPSPDPMTCKFDFPRWKHCPEMSSELKQDPRGQSGPTKKDRTEEENQRIADFVKIKTDNQEYPVPADVYEALKIELGFTFATVKSRMRKMADEGILKQMTPASGSQTKRYAYIGE